MTAQGAVIRQMIVKDFQLNRDLIVLTLAICAASLTALLVRREAVTVVGASVFFIALVIVGCMIPVQNLLNETKKQTLPFNLSLPVSMIHYTTSKLISSLGMFLILWLAMVLAAVWLIVERNVLPLGAVPVVLIVLMLPLVSMCIITGMTMVGETEGWNMAANILCNPSHGLIWYFITQTPSLMMGVGKDTPTWNRTVWIFLGSEAGIVIAVLALTYYLQSRKRDFI